MNIVSIGMAQVAQLARQAQRPAPPADTAVEVAQAAIDTAAKDLESQDKLGNFEIQDLMSRYNQAAGLASSVQKKSDDARSGVLGKIG